MPVSSSSVSQAKPPQKELPAGRSEARLLEQGVPRVEARGVVRPAQRSIRVPEDLDGTSQDLAVRVAPAYPARGDDVAIAAQIAAVLVAITMACPVVLVEHPC